MGGGVKGGCQGGWKEENGPCLGGNYFTKSVRFRKKKFILVILVLYCIYNNLIIEII